MQAISVNCDLRQRNGIRFDCCPITLSCPGLAFGPTSSHLPFVRLSEPEATFIPAPAATSDPLAFILAFMAPCQVHQIYRQQAQPFYPIWKPSWLFHRQDHPVGFWKRLPQQSSYVPLSKQISDLASQ